MESCDSSPDYRRATSNSDGKRENSNSTNSPVGSECDETISWSSSTQGSNINPLLDPYRNIGVKNKTYKKTLKSFRNLKTFRRRARSRMSKDMSDDVVTPRSISSLRASDESHETPHYMQATSSSKGKKAILPENHQISEFLSENSGRSSSHSSRSNVGSLQASSTALNLRNVKILIRRTTFKPKRSPLKYSRVSCESGDVQVDRATCSSTLKDSKFAKIVQHVPGEIEPEKILKMKVCRYHHCSLHGHSDEAQAHDHVRPPKRFLYKRRQSLKKQQSMKPKSSSDKNKDLRKGHMISKVQQFMQGERESIASSSSYVNDERDSEQKTRPSGDGFCGIQESGLVEMAFGEMSYPEESYRESVSQVATYVTQKQQVLCSRCACVITEQNESKTNDDQDFQNGDVDLKVSNIQNPSTSNHFDDVKEHSNVTSSSSDVQTPNYGESERELSAEVNTRIEEENKSRFGKVRHISMWHMIHRHMAESMVAESENKQLHGEDGSSVLLAKGSSSLSRDLSDSDMGLENNGRETQDIEVRKLLAVKLVREAIEKILLPEVQDQTSDDQSITSDSTHDQELLEKNQDEGRVLESSRDTREANTPVEIKEESFAKTDISGEEIVQAEKKSKSENKAPKRWSNLKKWILLQRFIKELEKVRKFNPRGPQHLPLKPDHEPEKVNLRPQTLDERKKAEEWMLDYALRQAVGQLAPTQKRKVSLLVKAFETVVTPNDDNTQKIASVADEVVDSVRQENATDKEAQEIVELKSDSNESKNMVVDGNGLSNEDEQESKVGVEPGVGMGPTISETKNGAHDIQSERQNYVRMWHSIYQHVVTGIAAKVGSQLLEGTDDDEEEDCNENCVSNNVSSALTKTDAVKLVQEAVDEILLPEIQDDSSDTQSVTSESEISVGNQKFKNWSKLKKLILLKRSIKALEKARKLNSQPPRQLSVMPETTQDKADLRHQMMDERKKAEQWMLDYAVQHIVTTLTPARKRRVSMLVEAFEAVVPLPELSTP